MMWSEKNGIYSRWFYYIISMVLVIADGWGGNEKDVGETGGIWWKKQGYCLGFGAYPYLPNTSARAGYDTRSIFKQSLTGLNSEFSFS